MPLNSEALNRIVDRWDSYHNERIHYGSLPESPGDHEERKNNENFYLKLLEQIEFMEKHFFSKFDLNDNSFKIIFHKWLEQFDLDEGLDSDELFYNQEIRYAFILTSRILFFTREQILSLLNVVWFKIRKSYFDCLVSAGGLSVYEAYRSKKEFLNLLQSSVFCPLSDSSKFEEFRHTLPQGVNFMVHPQNLWVTTGSGKSPSV